MVLGVTVTPGAGAMFNLATPSPVAGFHHAPGRDHASVAGPSTLSGVLRDSLGNALAGALFQVWGADSNCDAGGPVASATTASDGSFSLTVSPGSYDISTLYSGSATDPAFRVCTQDVDLSSSADETLTVPVTQLTVTVEDSSGDLLQGATVLESPEKSVEAGFDLIPGYPITAGDGYVETGTVQTSAAGVAVVPLMPLSSPLSLEVDPPAGTQLLPTAISTGLMTANTAVTATLAEKPGAPPPPTNVMAKPGNESAIVSWTAPTLQSGSVTGYTATASPGSQSCTTAGATTCTITGLTNGTTYTVTVIAHTTVGDSGPSAPVTVTPQAQTSASSTSIIASRGSARSVRLG
jgi:hypothetical protein